MRYFVTDYTSGSVSLPHYVRAFGTSKNGLHGFLSSEISCNSTCGSETDKEINIVVKSNLRSCRAKNVCRTCLFSLFFINRSRFFKCFLMIINIFGFCHWLRKKNSSIKRLFTNTSFMTKDKSISPIKYSIWNFLSFLDLTDSWHFIFNHRFKYLTLDKDRYRCHVCCLDHPLLCNHKFVRR